MLVKYKKATVEDIVDKTLYGIRVTMKDGQEFEMSSSGLISVDTGSTCGNFLNEVLVFEDQEEAIQYAKHAIKAFVYNKPISLVQVVPMKLDLDLFEEDITDPIETLDELNFELDVDNSVDVQF